MQPNEINEVLDRPLSQELLATDQVSLSPGGNFSLGQREPSIVQAPGAEIREALWVSARPLSKDPTHPTSRLPEVI